MSPRSLHGQGLSAAFMALTFLSFARPSGAVSAEAVRAFQYAAPPRQRGWDDYLESIRPAAVSADGRARSLAMVRKEDLIEPSAERQAKLEALRPVLEYLQRDTVVEVKILRLRLAWAGLLGGAAVLVSEEAIDLLTAEELQAGVAPALAHEDFFAEDEGAPPHRPNAPAKEV